MYTVKKRTAGIVNSWTNQFGSNTIIINVKTKLTTELAEVRVDDKVYKVDITPLEIKPENLFEDIGFGSVCEQEVNGKQLIASVTGQISPASFVGSIVITYEYHDKMLQVKSIDFQPYK